MTREEYIEYHGLEREPDGIQCEGCWKVFNRDTNEVLGGLCAECRKKAQEDEETELEYIMRKVNAQLADITKNIVEINGILRAVVNK